MMRPMGGGCPAGAGTTAADQDNLLPQLFCRVCRVHIRAKFSCQGCPKGPAAPKPDCPDLLPCTDSFRAPRPRLNN